MLRALSDEGADFLVVGAHARAVHGTPRATGDLDIWIRSTPGNARRVYRALGAFGAPLSELREEELTERDVVFQIGLPPSRIDILTSISGVSFEEAVLNKVVVRIAEIDVPVIGKADFVANKRAVGRLKDLADIEDVESPDESR